MVSVKQLMAEVRKPGPVSVPVVMSNDVARVVAEKKDLLAFLGELDPEARAPWRVYSVQHGVRNLDVQDDDE